MKTLKYIGLLLMLAIACGCGSSHPSDASLLANFENHEEDFETLLNMLREDKKLRRVDEDWTDPDDLSMIGVSEGRIRDYRALFAKLRVPRGFCAHHGPEVFTLIASTYGLSVSGSSKGYEYREEAPDQVVADLDSYWSNGDSFRAYRHIDGNWYLYFDFED